MVFAETDRQAATKVLERLRPVLTYSSITLHVEGGSDRGWRSHRDHQGVLYFASSDLFSDEALCDQLAVARAQDLKMFGIQLRPYAVSQPWTDDMLGARVALSTSPSVIDTVVADFRMAMRMWHLEVLGASFDVSDAVLLPTSTSRAEAKPVPARDTILSVAIRTIDAKLRNLRRGESVVCERGEGWNRQVVEGVITHFSTEWVVSEEDDPDARTLTPTLLRFVKK